MAMETNSPITIELRDVSLSPFHLLFATHDLDLVTMDNEEIARRFNRMASLMEVRGEDSFRIRSYRMAAEAIETWPTPMNEIAKEQGLSGLLEIPGVGKALAGKIIELIETGTFAAWEKLTAETPATVLDLLELPGVGPKTAATLHQKFKIASLEDLRKFIAGGGLELVDGIGQKTADRIKASLAGMN
jgi:DNA polymerase (family 10)